MTGRPLPPSPRVDGEAYARGAALATAGAALTAGQRTRFALRHPVLLWRYTVLVLALPVLDLPLTQLPAGLYLRRQLGDSWRRSASHVALPLPDSLADYLRGRARQAVRTNLRHAEQAGLSARALEPDEVRAAVASYDRQADFHGESSRLEDPQTTDFSRYWAVTDRLGEVLAIALVAQDRDAALLRVLIGPKDRSLAHQSRYLLHTAVVADLIADGVRYLMVEAVLGAPAGHKYFAARLGYRACRVRLTGQAVLRPARGSRAPTAVPLDWT